MFPKQKEEAKKDLKLAGKRSYVHTITEHTASGIEILRCSFANCSKSWPANSSGRASMSRHMKKHKQAGTPLSAKIDDREVVRIFEKYNYIQDEDSKDTVRSSAPDLPKVTKPDVPIDTSDPISVAEWAERAEYVTSEVGARLTKWTMMEDEEFETKAPYPILARNLMQYSKYTHIKTIARIKLLEDRVDNLNARVTALNERIVLMKKTVDSFPKQVAEMREDVRNMTLITFDKANELHEIAAGVDVVQRKIDISDIRAKLEGDAKNIAYHAARLGVEDCVRSSMQKAAVQAQKATIKAIRTAVTYGLPKEGGLDKVLPIMSKEDVEEEKEWLASAPRSHRRGTRQIEAQATKRKKVEEHCSEELIGLELDAVNHLLAESIGASKKKLTSLSVVPA